MEFKEYNSKYNNIKKKINKAEGEQKEKLEKELKSLKVMYQLSHIVEYKDVVNESTAAILEQIKSILNVGSN